MIKRLGWNPGNEMNRINIMKRVQAYDDEGEPDGAKNIKVGHLSFWDMKDVVRFGLHVAKNCGISPEQYEKLKEEIKNEMGGWE